MTRLSVLALSVLIAAAPLEAAAAQDRRDRGGPQGAREGPSIGAAEASAIAQSRARSQVGGDTRGLISHGLHKMEGSNYVFRFEHNGRIFDIVVAGG